MKKWLVLMIALVMVFTAAAGVSANTAAVNLTAEKGAKLIVWESADQYAYMYKIAQDFTRKTKIPVTVQKIEITEQIAKVTLAKKGASNSPDVLTLPHDKLGEAVSAKLVIPNNAFAAKTKGKTSKAAADAVTYNKVLYGYPKSIESVALIYNTAIVKSPPKTWDDVIKLSKVKSIHDPAAKKYAAIWPNGAYFNHTFIGSNGGFIFKNRTDKSVLGLNSAGTVKSLTEYLKIRNALYPASLKVASIDYSFANSAFESKKAAMTINGPWAIKGYQDKGIKIGVAKIPAFGKEVARPFSGVRGYYVSSKAMYPKAAQIFADWATEYYAQLELYKADKGIPATTSVAASTLLKKDPIILGFMNQFNDSVPMPNIPEMGSFWSNGDTMLADVFDKKLTPKAAADKAQANLKKSINK